MDANPPEHTSHPPGFPDTAQLSEVEVAVGERRYRLLGIDDLVRYASEQPKGTEAPYWGIVWEASMGLGQWMIEHADVVRGKTVLELGCGLGLSGIVASDLGGHVTQTDKIPAALAAARESARLNKVPPISQFCADWLEWDHTTDYDLIIGSDLVYDSAMVPPLLPIFRRNCRDGGRILIAAPLRDPALHLIDSLYADGWDFETDSRRIEWQRRETEIAIWLGSRK